LQEEFKVKAPTLKVSPKRPKQPKASIEIQKRNPPPEDMLMIRNKYDDSAAAEEEDENDA
jgi:hypothetical protein